MAEEVSVEHPSVFQAAGRVHVYKDGRPFYVFERPGSFRFTLPAGTYRLEGGSLIGPMRPRKGAPTMRALVPLPPKVTLQYCDNPSKAQIDLRAGKVYLDNKFREAPEFVRTFILLHEIGHYFHRTETGCDTFAAREMWRRGYNASQIHTAATMSLSHHAADRIVSNYLTAKSLKDGR